MTKGFLKDKKRSWKSTWWRRIQFY